MHWKIKIWRIIGIIIFSCSIFISMPVYAKVERSAGEQAEGIEKYLERELVLVMHKDKTVTFIWDGRINLWGYLFNANYTLGLNETFSSPPDPHGNTVFKVAKIDDDAVQLNYELRFDHHSFGPDLITEDTGTITVKYSPEWAQAAYYGNTDILNALINNGLDVNTRDSFGRAALMIAAFYGHLDMAKLLLSKGADVNAQQKKGLSALMLAMNYPEIVKLLIQNGADINAKDKNDNTVLLYAVKYPAVVKLLLDGGADVNTKYAEKALMWAVRFGDPETVKLFINKGVDVNAKVNNWTILKWAMYENQPNPEVLRILKEAGAHE